MPCPVEGGRFKRGFLPVPDPTVQKGHYGVDISVGVGTPVTATAAGTILRAADNPTYGNTIVIDHGVNAAGNHIYTLYAHLNSSDIDVVM